MNYQTIAIIKAVSVGIFSIIFITSSFYLGLKQGIKKAFKEWDSRSNLD